MSKLTIAVIIVNYNTGKMLKDVITAVLQDKSVDEIILVDNNSTDDSMTLVDDHAKIKKFYKKDNKGFGSSCNFAAKQTKAQYLVFLNPDCFCQKNTVEKAINTLKQDSKTAICGVLVQNPDGSEQRASRRRLPTLWRAIKTYSQLEKLAKICSCFAGVNLNWQKMPSQIQTVEAISGAFIAMKAAVFNEIQGFDEGFILHFEDLDLFKRCQNAGYHLRFNPDIKVTHYQGTSSTHNPQVKALKKQGLIRYFKKHNTKLAYGIVKLLLFRAK